MDIFHWHSGQECEGRPKRSRQVRTMPPKERWLVPTFGAQLPSQAAQGELGQQLDEGRRFGTTPSCSQRGAGMVWRLKAERLMGAEMYQEDKQERALSQSGFPGLLVSGDLGQATSPVKASVYTSVKWGSYFPFFSSELATEAVNLFLPRSLAALENGLSLKAGQWCPWPPRPLLGSDNGLSSLTVALWRLQSP